MFVLIVAVSFVRLKALEAVAPAGPSTTALAAGGASGGEEEDRGSLRALGSYNLVDAAEWAAERRAGLKADRAAQRIARSVED